MPEVAGTRLKIGMEIHIELATRSKMFSRSANGAHPDHYDALPNTLVDPVVAALPGALPVMNRQAVEMAMMVGMALNCTIASFTKWDRKNYFYPDLPKGYQISQYDLPLCFDGQLLIADADGHEKKFGILRAHLEEDTGKLGHELPGGHAYAGSLVDLNRAGTPLLEIVTQPDMDNADDAVNFGRELRAICRALGVTEGDMQRGHMRFEPNVNVIIETDDGREQATPIVEVKNLNSFRALRDAIEFEYTRQVKAWQADGVELAPGRKTTRGWDDERRVTVLQREKEEAHDYRYFPEPDLVPILVDDAWRRDIAARLPELPMPRRARYRDELELPAVDAAALTQEREHGEFFELCLDAIARLHGSTVGGVPGAGPARTCAKLLLNAGARRAREHNVGLHETGITPDQVAGLINLREHNEIGSSAADDLFERLCETDDVARDVAERHGLLQISDQPQLEQWCREAIAAQPAAAEDYRGGKEAALGRLVGQVMKLSRGQADARAVTQMLRKAMSE